MVGSIHIDTKEQMVSNLFDGRIFQKNATGWHKFDHQMYRSVSAPTNAVNNDIWLCDENNTLYLYENNHWVETNRSIYFTEEQADIDTGNINDYNVLSGIIEIRPLIRFGSCEDFDKQGKIIGYVNTSNNYVYNFNKVRIGKLNDFDEVEDINDATKIIGKVGKSLRLVRRPKNTEQGETSDKIVGYVDGILAITFTGEIIGKIVNNRIRDKNGNISYKADSSETKIVYDYNAYDVAYINPNDNRLYVKTKQGDYKVSFDGEEPNRSLSMATALSFNTDLYPQLTCRKSINK